MVGYNHPKQGVASIVGAAEQLSQKAKVADLFKSYEHFCKSMLDAYAVIDFEGKVVKCNQFFSALVGEKAKKILKANSIDDLLILRESDRNIPVTSLLKHTAPTRLDEIMGQVSKREDILNLIVGIYPFVDEGQVVGAFLLIRDVTAEAELQGKYKDKATQSVTDALTSLYNRAYFEKALPRHLESMNDFPEGSKQRSTSIFMLDIDHFKQTNDTFGHQAGDYIISKVAEIIKQKCRNTDILCRYGGEEFLGIFPETSLDGGQVAAEKIRKAIEEFEFVFDGQKIPTTVSIGIAQVRLNLESGEQTIGRADEALYFAKQNGRNKVSTHNNGKCQ